MGFRVYPMLHCMECGEAARLIAVCEKPGSQTEARFYECANPACRYTFKSSVPVMAVRGARGTREETAPEIKP